MNCQVGLQAGPPWHMVELHTERTDSSTVLLLHAPTPAFSSLVHIYTINNIVEGRKWTIDEKVSV